MKIIEIRMPQQLFARPPFIWIFIQTFFQEIQLSIRDLYSNRGGNSKNIFCLVTLCVLSKCGQIDLILPVKYCHFHEKEHLQGVLVFAELEE